MKSKYVGIVVLAVGMLHVGLVWSKDNCAATRVGQVRNLSDACLSKLSKALEVELDRRYEKIAVQLPVTGAPESEDEFAGLGQGDAKQVYANWKTYVQTFCRLKANSLGLSRKYESRENSRCWVREAQRHVESLKDFKI